MMRPRPLYLEEFPEYEARFYEKSSHHLQRRLEVFCSFRLSCLLFTVQNHIFLLDILILRNHLFQFFLGKRQLFVALPQLILQSSTSPEAVSTTTRALPRAVRHNFSGPPARES